MKICDFKVKNYFVYLRIARVDSYIEIENIDDRMKMDAEQETDNQSLITDTFLTQEIDAIIVFGTMSYNSPRFPNNR